MTNHTIQWVTMIYVTVLQYQAMPPTLLEPGRFREGIMQPWKSGIIRAGRVLTQLRSGGITRDSTVVSSRTQSVGEDKSLLITSESTWARCALVLTCLTFKSMRVSVNY